MRWTTNGLAPALMASDAAVCRSACAETRGNSASAAWHRGTANANHDDDGAGGPSGVPVLVDHSSASRSLPAHASESASSTNAGRATERAFPVAGAYEAAA